MASYSLQSRQHSNAGGVDALDGSLRHETQGRYATMMTCSSFLSWIPLPFGDVVSGEAQQLGYIKAAGECESSGHAQVASTDEYRLALHAEKVCDMDSVRAMMAAVFWPAPKPTQGIVVNDEMIQRREPESFPDTSKGVVSWKTLISAPQTATNSLTVGMASCPPQKGHLCPHRHTEAEIYHIISGRGIMRIDGHEQQVAAGSVVYIPGDAEHGIRNEDPDEELKWLYVFGTDSFQNIRYRF